MDVRLHLESAERFLSGLESGSISSSDCFELAEKVDGVLLFYSLRYLRARYPQNHPDFKGISSRLLDFSATFPEMVSKIKEAEEDPICEWFNDTYNMSDFYGNPEGMLSVLLEKIES